MFYIITLSLLLNLYQIYIIGKQKQEIDLKQKFIDKWIDKERTLIK